MTWFPIQIPATVDPWATPYGFVIDHIWREPGTNAARRPHWPERMFIVVLPCEDLDPPSGWNEGATHWVFFDDGIEYVPSAPKLKKQPTSLADLLVLEFEVDDIVPDTLATDWLVGALADA